MDILEIIEKKKTSSLSKEEINFFIEGYTSGSVADYQAAALLMEIYLLGMTREETFYLTDAMTKSGETVDLSAVSGVKVDKHSTGGVGDTATLVLAPLLASIGLKVAKMSGRGLGFSGGTLDKLQSIPGYDINPSLEKFQRLVEEVGCSVIGQSGNLAPADKKIYALRDVTGTVGSIPLIASSVMSKKLAAGADVILLDVKTGSGAFMKTVEDAITLGKQMVEIGEMAGKKMGVLVTSMDQPLGEKCGNSLEIISACEVLKNRKCRLRDEVIMLCLKLATLSGKFKTEDEARLKIEEALENGKAFDKFVEMVQAQGGDTSYLLDTSKFALGNKVEVFAGQTGYISKINTENLGRSIVALGGGRKEKDDVIDPSVGIEMVKSLGDYVNKGDVVLYVYENGKGLADALKLIAPSFEFSLEKPAGHSLAIAYITKDGVEM